MLGVFLICAAVVYMLIPLLNKCGLELNDFGHKTRKRQTAVKALERAMEKHLEEVGLTWQDVEDMHRSVVALSSESLCHYAPSRTTIWRPQM